MSKKPRTAKQPPQPIAAPIDRKRLLEELSYIDEQVRKRVGRARDVVYASARSDKAVGAGVAVDLIGMDVRAWVHRMASDLGGV